MTEQDRFGLSGAPDIQRARRRPFGSAFPLYPAALLGLSVGVIVLPFLDRSTSGSWPVYGGYGVVLVQTVAALWGAWAVARSNKSEQWGRNAAVIVFLLVGNLRNAGKLLADLTAQRPLDTFDISVTVLVSAYVIFLGIKLSRQQ